MTGSLAYAITLPVWTLLYFAPGVLLAEMLLSSTFTFSKRLVVGIAASISIYIVLGYIFSRLSILSHNTAVASVVVLDVLLIVAYLVWRHRRGRDLREALAGLTKRDMLIALALLLLFVICILVFFSWENQSPGIGAWDRSDHLPRMIYLDHHHQLPAHELGTEVSPYYPRGLHTAALFYTSPFFAARPAVELSSPFLAFLAVCIGLFPLAVYAISLSCFEDRQSALFAALSFLILSFTFIFSSFPCTLGMLLAAAAILLEIEFVRGKCGVKPFLIFALLASVVLLIHLVSFLALIALSVAVLAAALVSGEKIGFKRRNAWLVAGLIVASLVLPLLFLAVTSPALLKGTRTYMGVRETGEAKVSNMSPGKFFGNIFRFRFLEVQIVFGYCMALVPFLLLGVLHLLRRRLWVPLFLLLMGVFLSVSKLVWFMNRTQFYLFIPLTLVCGYGLRLFLTHRRSGPHAIVAWAVVIALFTAVTLGTSSLYAEHGSVLVGEGFFGLEGRLQTYVTQEAYELARWIEENGLEDMRFASDDQGSHYLLVEALTDTRIIMASRFSGVQSFSDISELFDPETPRQTRLDIMEEYRVQGLLTTSYWEANRLLRDDLGLEVVMPVTGFYVLLPIGTLAQDPGI